MCWQIPEQLTSADEQPSLEHKLLQIKIQPPMTFYVPPNQYIILMMN
jgi:hypothetical protein